MMRHKARMFWEEVFNLMKYHNNIIYHRYFYTTNLNNFAVKLIEFKFNINIFHYIGIEIKYINFAPISIDRIIDFKINII